jgi:hypothetical protein
MHTKYLSVNRNVRKVITTKKHKMSNTETAAGSNDVNLNNKEAVDKLKSLVNDIMV